MKEVANRIKVNEKIRFGKSVIKGTRVPVEIIIGKLASGMSFEEILQEYDLAKADILAALHYASKTFSSEKVIAVS
jgi:uncharacterized protein (DUF433 family)